MKHITTGVRDQSPALNVKDHLPYAHHAPYAELIAELGEDQTGALYDQAAERFWSDVALLAIEAGYEWHQGGRSGGWLIVTGGHGHFLDYIVDAAWTVPPADDTADDDTREEYTEAIAARDRFMVFAGEVDDAFGQARTYFLDLLREAKADLDSARESAIVRGEN